MSKFSGIIFDIDGTLAATNDLIFASFNHVAEKYLNKKLSNEEIVSLFGPTEDVILKHWMNVNYKKAREDYFNFYTSNHDKMANIFPGLKEVLEIIKRKNIPLGIFTGKGRDSSIITLKAIGVHDYFNMIITGDDVNEHKPSPEGINKFVSEYNLLPENVLMVGDAPVDVMAARKAGVKIALVLWDSYAKKKVLNIERDYTFNKIDEFTKFLENNI